MVVRPTTLQDMLLRVSQMCTVANSLVNGSAPVSAEYFLTNIYFCYIYIYKQIYMVVRPKHVAAK
jgi:hypothetical protein